MFNEREDSNTKDDDKSIQTTGNIVRVVHRKLILNPPKQKLRKLKEI